MRRRSSWPVVGAALLTSIAVIVGTGAAQAAGTSATNRVSIGTNGVAINYPTTTFDISDNGRFVLFSGRPDTFGRPNPLNTVNLARRDLTTAQTVPVDVAQSGELGDGRVSGASISSDGRYVAFSSDASNLMSAGGTNSMQIFRRDMQTGQVVLVSRSRAGTKANAGALEPSISANGRFIAYSSHATNLVTEAQPQAGCGEIFVSDMTLGLTWLISRTTANVPAACPSGEGSQEPQISADGQTVAFLSGAADLVAGFSSSTFTVYVRHRETMTTEVASLDISGAGLDAQLPSISADGRKVAFAVTRHAAPGGQDVYVRDLAAHTTTLASVTSAGTTSTASRASVISANGRFVTFLTNQPMTSGTHNGKLQLYRRDLVTNSTLEVSASTAGVEANDSQNPNFSSSGDGGSVLFTSPATNLVPADTNNNPDAFVRVVR